MSLRLLMVQCVVLLMLLVTATPMFIKRSMNLKRDGKCAPGIACQRVDECVTVPDLCDGVPHCSDGSDESDVTCGPGSRNIQCEDGSGVWIAIRQICDGVNDCTNSGEDEDATLCDAIKATNNGKEEDEVCSDGELLCENGKGCINMDDLCNDKNDCEDGSDESKKTCGANSKNIECEDGSNVWIGLKQLCDGVKDCYISGEDEADELCGE